MRSSIFQGCLPTVLLEYILEIGLAGKAKITADFAQRFIRIPQQGLGLPEFAFGDVGSNGSAKFPTKFIEQIGSALAGEGDNIRNIDGFVDMGGDKLHTCVNFLRNTGGKFLLSDPFGKINGHIILQVLDCFLSLQLFAFLDVGVDELVSLLNIHTSRNGSEFTNHGYQTDKQVFCLP